MAWRRSLIYLVLAMAVCLAWSCVLFARDLRDRFRVEVGLLVSLLALIGFLIEYAYSLHLSWLRATVSPLDHLGAAASFSTSRGLVISLLPVYVVKGGIYLRSRRRQWQVKEYVAVFLAIGTLELVGGFLIMGLWATAWYVTTILWLGLAAILVLRLVKLPEEVARLVSIVSRHFGVAVGDNLKHFFSLLTKVLTKVAFWRFLPSLQAVIDRREAALEQRRNRADVRAQRDDQDYEAFAARQSSAETALGHRIRSRRSRPPGGPKLDRGQENLLSRVHGVLHPRADHRCSADRPRETCLV